MPDIKIINGPLSLYWAPVGETFPAIGASPAGNWALIGSSGAHHYHEDGVVVKPEKSISYFRSLASGYPIKAFITEADVIVTVRMVDFTLAQLRLALNQNAITSDSGFDYGELDVGLDVNEIALLVRGTGKSPMSSGNNMQFNLNRVVEENSQEWSFVKGDPVVSELVFRVIYDVGQSFPAGRLLQDDT